MRRALPTLVLGCLLAVVTLVTVLLGSDRGPRTPARLGPVDGILPDRPGVVVPLPSSGWKPGDDALESAMTGVIRVRADGCVVAGQAEPMPVPRGDALLWPAGWSARRAADGQVEILDPDGGVVLREGDGFHVGGGGGAAVDWACGKKADGMFVMMDIPRKVPAPAPDPTAGPGTPVRVPTSAWTPDQPAMTDLFTGRELAAEGSCVFGRPTAPAHAGERTAIVWPAGWTAQRSAADGRVEILDDLRRVMLREGDHIWLGGGLRPYPGAAASTCRPGTAEAFIVHGGVTATKRVTPGFRG
jgi:hypothetical protein